MSFYRAFLLYLYKRKEDEEFLQVLTRFMLIVFVVGTVSIFDNSYLKRSDIALSLLLYLSLVAAHTAWVVRRPGHVPIRRIMAIVMDIGFISMLTYLIGVDAIALYPLLIWIVMGNGLRFGLFYFYAALISAIGIYGLALHANSFWQMHNSLRYSLIGGLLFMILLNRKVLKNLSLFRTMFEKRLKKEVGSLIKEYHYDALTGLQNRIALEKIVAQESENGILIIDIDGFHYMNELYGMEKGNAILKAFAESMTIFARKYNMHLFRVYGDVFALHCVAPADGLKQLQKIASDLCRFVDSGVPVCECMEDVSKFDVTIGIALSGADALNKAETALSFAKKHSKQFVAYSQIIDSSEQIADLLRTQYDIKEAIQSDNIVPLFQPIVDRHESVAKYEALMRLRKVTSTKEQLVSPAVFLDAAVKTKQYQKLTLMMIEKSFYLMSQLRHPFSVNLSFEDIYSHKVMDTIKASIVKYDLGDLLTIEILESEEVKNYMVIKQFIAELKQMGVKIAIDDFGSGFSNFSHLLELEPDFIKIDGSLIKNLDHDKKAYAFVKSIVQLAQELNIKTVAEFVSTREIFDITYALGIDFFQGYYFSTPLSATQLNPALLPRIQMHNV